MYQHSLLNSQEIQMIGTRERICVRRQLLQPANFFYLIIAVIFMSLFFTTVKLSLSNLALQWFTVKVEILPWKYISANVEEMANDKPCFLLELSHHDNLLELSSRWKYNWCYDHAAYRCRLFKGGGIRLCFQNVFDPYALTISLLTIKFIFDKGEIFSQLICALL